MNTKPEAKKVQAPNDSIHPRVVTGRTKFKKVNTKGIADPATELKLRIALREHTKRHPRDYKSVGRLVALGS